jgi:hypothetical protein
MDLQATSDVDEDSGDPVLLAIKDAELASLRQQISQLADDLKRNAAVRDTDEPRHLGHLVETVHFNACSFCWL